MNSGFYEVMQRKTSRVKSVAFHRKKPVILVAQYDGLIQAYDYQLNILIHEFKDHLGPVRSVVYSPILDIFASGGDDIKIRIWDYYSKKIINVFEGHKDYVRSLDFHPHKPYLLSSSDDQTIKIWNFQSNKLVATLNGHMHYVMCSKFFLDHFIVSCSLDQTIRIWDYKNINQKNSMLGLMSIYPKQIIDGHDKGINNIAIYKNTFATVSDDKEVKLWEFDKNTVSEKEVFYHHQNIVSSVLLTENYILTNGEDGILALHSFSKKSTKKFIIEGRFWCISGNDSFYCIGHDSGFYLFSLQNLYCIFCYSNGLYYLKKKSIYYNNFELEKKIISCKKNIVSIQSIVHNPDRDSDKRHVQEINQPGLDKTIILAQSENSFEIFIDGQALFSENGVGLLFDNFVVAKNGTDIFKFSISGNILCKNNQNKYEKIFKAGNLILASRGCWIFLISPESLEVEKSKSINFEVEKVYYSDKYIAVLDRNNLAIIDYLLNYVSVVHEIAPINSGFFSEDTFFYSTIRQIKFLNQDSGILKSVDNAHIFHRQDSKFYYLRDSIESVILDLTELYFKKAIREQDAAHPEKSSQENIKSVKNIIESGNLPGLAPLDFLIKNKRGDIALPYISDERQKFELCLSNKKYYECLDICKKLEERIFYKKLAESSVVDCFVDVAEQCFAYLGDHQSLFMLYLCSKQEQKIRELYKYASPDVRIGIAKYIDDHDAIKDVLEAKNFYNNTLNDQKESESLDRKSFQTTRKENELPSSDSNQLVDVNHILYRKDLLDSKIEYIIPDINWEEEYEKALDFFKDLKLGKSLRILKRIFYSKIDKEDIRKKISPYLSALAVEKMRRKICDPLNSVEIALYISSLELDRNVCHKFLIKYAIEVLFLHENYKDAKSVNDKWNLDSEKVQNWGVYKNKFDVQIALFCYDSLKFEKLAKKCSVCYMYSLNGSICGCCNVGILK